MRNESALFCRAAGFLAQWCINTASGRPSSEQCCVLNVVSLKKSAASMSRQKREEVLRLHGSKTAPSGQISDRTLESEGRELGPAYKTSAVKPTESGNVL